MCRAAVFCDPLAGGDSGGVPLWQHNFWFLSMAGKLLRATLALRGGFRGALSADMGERMGAFKQISPSWNLLVYSVSESGCGR